MKIKGRLIFKFDNNKNNRELVDIILESLAPDNLPEIKTQNDETSATVTFSADKIGTLLSSVDDYLMNAKIAGDIMVLL